MSDEELVRQGHEVLLFATGDSITQAQLVPCCPKAIREFEQWVDPIAYHAVVTCDRVRRR